MKNLPWIIAAAGALVAAYFVINTPGPEHATGSDNLEDAARRTAGWGSQQRVTGTAANFLGKVKEGFGRATGDGELADNGATDQVTGTLKNAAGQVAQAAGQTLHDLNR